MGGTEKARWHAVEPLQHGAFAHTQLARTLAGDVAERAAERAQASPAGVERDLGDGKVGVAEQRLRALDPPRQQVAVRGDAEGLLERAREVRLGDGADAREPLDRPLLVRGGVHLVLGAQQAPQQLGVLGHAHECSADPTLAPNDPPRPRGR